MKEFLYGLGTVCFMLVAPVVVLVIAYIADIPSGYAIGGIYAIINIIRSILAIIEDNKRKKSKSSSSYNPNYNPNDEIFQNNPEMQRIYNTYFRKK